ncbi:pilin [Luteimonas aquatica]|uniref:pilin n=1 Tax=Luteimonas aquatica TaxID=450364 RepID=UPI001F583B4D|nr:pilin [Luteimonas aquatica]
MNHRIEPHSGDASPPPLPPRAPQHGPAPRKRMSGCLIVLLVCAALAIPAIGILAAIAVPQYQRYVLRAKALQASTTARSLAIDVAQEHARLGHCPAAEKVDPQTLELRSDAGIAEIVTGEWAPGRCGARVLLQGRNGFDGRHIAWEFSGMDENAQWRCDSNLDPAYLPASCPQQ